MPRNGAARALAKFSYRWGMRIGAAGFFALVLALAACASSTPEAKDCTPGTSVACTCTSGKTGAQSCSDNGSSYGPCECTGSGGSGGSVGGGAGWPGTGSAAGSGGSSTGGNAGSGTGGGDVCAGHCGNGTKDCGETSTDCGGGECGACVYTQADCIQSANNGSEVCDDEAWQVATPGKPMVLVCINDNGGVTYVSSNTGPKMSDGVERCQGWETNGQNAWDYLQYISKITCDSLQKQIDVDLSTYVGTVLHIGTHDNPAGGGHNTPSCLAWKK